MADVMSELQLALGQLAHEYDEMQNDWKSADVAAAKAVAVKKSCTASGEPRLRDFRMHPWPRRRSPKGSDTGYKSRPALATNGYGGNALRISSSVAFDAIVFRVDDPHSRLDL